MSVTGHSHFIATNVRSGRTYRTDSASFPTGYFTAMDCPSQQGNWWFGVCDCAAGHPFSRTAHLVKEAAPARRRFAAKYVGKTPAARRDPHHGLYLCSGDEILGGRGDKERAVFEYISRASIPGKSGKVVVTVDGYEMEHYDRVWNIEVVEVDSPFAAPIGARISLQHELFAVAGEITVTVEEERS